MMMAVAGRTDTRSYASLNRSVNRWGAMGLAGVHRMVGDGETPEACRGPHEGGLDYMKKVSVTVGRAGRLSVHTLDERALGMMETEHPPSCMQRIYRPQRVVP